MQEESVLGSAGYSESLDQQALGLLHLVLVKAVAVNQPEADQ